MFPQNNGRVNEVERLRAIKITKRAYEFNGGMIYPYQNQAGASIGTHLRDHLASLAMRQIIAAFPTMDAGEIAKRSYEISDAMIKEKVTAEEKLKKELGLNE